MAEDAVSSEPFSAEFPANRENTGNFADFGQSNSASSPQVSNFLFKFCDQSPISELNRAGNYQERIRELDFPVDGL
jgi:hypothetical protein